VKGFQKITLVTSILGLVILVPVIVGYGYANSLIGIPILGLFLGGLILHVILLIVVNLASLYVAFKMQNKKIVGILLIVCGIVILAIANLLGIPGCILFSLAGILALKESRLSTTESVHKVKK
jgi:hypothetical protein